MRRIYLLVMLLGLSLLMWSQVPVPASAGVPGGPFAYVANLSSGDVSVIDLSTETEDTTIATGGEPYWVAISADGSVVAASLHDDTGVALIDGTTNTLLGVVGGVGGEPEAVAVNSDGSTVYVADEGDDALYVVDVASETVSGSDIGLAGTVSPIDLSSDCSEPENMVISPDDASLYITCAGSEVIRVATSNFAITSIDTGLSDPHGIALNPAGTRLYYTDGTDVFEWNTVSESLTATTFDGCDMYGGRVSPDGSQLLCQEENGDLMVYDTSDGSLFDSVDTGGTAVDVNPSGARAYVPDGDVVRVVDLAEVKAAGGPLLDDIDTSGDGGRGIAIGPARLSTAGFKCYRAVGFHFDVDDPDLLLDDQFQLKEATLGAPNALCNPVEKGDDGDGGGAGGNFVTADHYGCFEIEQEGFFFDFVDVENQFGEQGLLVKQASQLCVRSEKEGDDGGPEVIGVLDQMKCYRAVWTDWEDFAPFRIQLEDQFRETEAVVLWPVSLCTPVEVFDEQFQVNGQGSGAPFDGDALVCYRIWEPGLEVNFVGMNNLFGSYDLLVLWAQTLCVPSTKLNNGD